MELLMGQLSQILRDLNRKLAQSHARQLREIDKALKESKDLEQAK